MTKAIVICGNLFDGLSDALLGPTEILIEGDTIVEVSSSVGRPAGAQIYDLSNRTVSPRLHRCACPSLHRRFEAREPNAAANVSQGARGTPLCAAIHAARLHDASGYGGTRSRMAHNRPAQRNRYGYGHRTTLDRGGPYDQFNRGAWRLARDASVPLPDGTLAGCGFSGKNSRAGTNGTCVRWQLDQDDEHRRLHERR